ncbi:MAG: thiol-disulfide isomerase [Acidobacteriota bacterium]|nr:thiol-disulfide isomerase [Acidobacteriota bacterium]
MPLGSYAQVRPWAKAIKEAVLAKKMPPWFADPHYGKFANDLSLNSKDIATLVAWVDGGAHEGSSAAAANPADSGKWAGGWRITQPDAVFELPQPVTIPGSGTLNYMYFSVPTGFTEDRWVESVEVRPSNRAVVHHAIVLVQSYDSRWGSGFLAGYAPGAVPQRWKPGQARLIRAGSNLIFQMHYTTLGKAGSGRPSLDRTQVGMVFARQPVTHQIVASQAVNHSFEIPPGEPDYKVESASLIDEPAMLVGLRPHMHVRGKSFEYRAVYPDGSSEILLRVPKYDFNWQPYYYLATPLKLPTGTRIECVAHFDNSANNAFNPNPKVPVRWGDQSWDEMMIGWFDLAVPVQQAKLVSSVR